MKFAIAWSYLGIISYSQKNIDFIIERKYYRLLKYRLLSFHLNGYIRGGGEELNNAAVLHFFIYIISVI